MSVWNGSPAAKALLDGRKMREEHIILHDLYVPALQ